MSRIAPMRPPFQKAGSEPRDPARLEAVAALPCVICHEWGMTQLSPTQVHHCIHGRYGTLRAYGNGLDLAQATGFVRAYLERDLVELTNEPAGDLFEWGSA